MYAKNLLESSIFSFFFMTALFISKLYFETLSSFVTSLENFLIKRNKQSAFAFSWILFLGWIAMIAIKLLRTKWIEIKKERWIKWMSSENKLVLKIPQNNFFIVTISLYFHLLQIPMLWYGRICRSNYKKHLPFYWESFFNIYG